MTNDIRLGGQQFAPVTTAQQAQPVRAAVVARPQPMETSSSAAEVKADQKESRRILQEATERLNRQMTRSSRDLSFSVDDVADTVVITVKNRDSGEVVRQIPSEVALRVAHNLDDMKGLLQDQKS